jgi:hypothetical protein
MRMRGRRILAAAVLLAGGVAAASAFGAGAHVAGLTLTVTATGGAGTVTVDGPDAAAEAALQAGRDDPAKVAQVPDVPARRALQRELRRLDGFLATRPRLRPYRAHLWYVAHRGRSRVDARQLAALLWCTVWFPRDCG